MWRDQRATIEALNPEAEEKSLRKWNNQQCDCEVLASHIRAKHDVFVTSDIKEFQANEVELKKIGANCFMTPCEVVTVFL